MAGMSANTGASRLPEPVDPASPSPAPWRRLADAAGLIDERGRLSSTIFEEMSFLAARHGAINLGQGFPDTDGPEILREALAEAVAGGGNQYATIAGDPDLRRGVAEAEERAGRRRPDPETEVTVTAGATEALAAAMLAHLRPGDEVVFFEPFYDLYPAVAALAGAAVRTVPLRPPHFRPDPEDLAAAFTERTRMVVVNDPHNPTGTVLGEETARRVVQLAAAHDALILTDSVYEHLHYDADPVDLAGLPGAAERTIRVSAASKTFSVTGWRVGWAIAPQPLTRALRVTKGYLSHSAAAPLQAAVARALAWAEQGSFYPELHERYRRQRDVLLEGLSATRLEVCAPEGTFFAVARVGRDAPEWAGTGAQLAQALPERAGVAVVPLSAFATQANAHLYADWVRFAFCKRPEVLREATRRIAAAGL